MCAVHASRGRSSRPRRTCCSEVGDRLPAGRGARSGDDGRIDWAGFARRLRPRSGDHIARVVPGCDGLQRAGPRSRAASCCRTRPRDPRDLPDRDRQGACSRSTRLERAGRARGPRCCCRPCAATTSSTPRSTASTTATAASRSGRRVVFVQPGRPRRPRPRRTATCVDIVSEWHGRIRSAWPRRVPRRRLPHAARLRRGLLPRDQRAGPAGLTRAEGSNTPVVEGGHRPARAEPGPDARRRGNSPCPGGLTLGTRQRHPPEAPASRGRASPTPDMPRPGPGGWT